jgi:NADH-quinone oxidoreductase subunit G
VNAEGRLQSFHAVVKPLGDARPAWKIFRVLANMLGLSGFAYESTADVLAQALPGVLSGEFVSSSLLSNAAGGLIDLAPADEAPCVASIYALDGLVRRAPALQATNDARPVAAAHQGIEA